MQSKMCSILIIGMVILLAVVPASAYDYRGVPRPGENNPDIQAEDLSIAGEDISSGLEDLSGILDSPEISSLISMVIALILQLFGISPDLT